GAEVLRDVGLALARPRREVLHRQFSRLVERIEEREADGLPQQTKPPGGILQQRGGDHGVGRHNRRVDSTRSGGPIPVFYTEPFNRAVIQSDLETPRPPCCSARSPTPSSRSTPTSSVASGRRRRS